MDKFIAIFQKTPMAHKAAAVAGIIVLMGVYHYYMIYSDQAKTLKGLEQQQTKLEAELQEKQEIAGNLTKFQNRVKYLQQKLEEKKKNLPNNANLDQLLKTLNELSEKSDMRIVKFTPKGEISKNFYAEIPVRIEMEGNYHEIATFFDKVAKEDRIINISAIDLSKPQIKNSKVVLKGSCTAKTFKAIEKNMIKKSRRRRR